MVLLILVCVSSHTLISPSTFICIVLFVPLDLEQRNFWITNQGRRWNRNNSGVSLAEFRGFTLGFFILYFWKLVTSIASLVSVNITTLYHVTQLRNLWLIFYCSLSTHSHPAVTNYYWFDPLNISSAHFFSTSVSSSQGVIPIFPIYHLDH